MFSANTSQVSDDKLFVEDVFSTFLYTGNGGTQTITNGIDLAGKGGLVWIKARSSAQNNVLADTANGTSLWLSSNTTDGQSGGSVVTAFSSTGFNTGGNTNYVAGNGVTYASWTFRKAPKFFDVVTYTGDGTGNRTISHSLTTSPGMVIIRPTNLSTNWRVWHRYDSTKGLRLNLTDAQSTNDFLPSVSSTGITVDTTFNGSGNTYVAYLFSHDATSDGIIQCGSYTGTNAAGNTVTLGWEPQWVLIKNTTNAQFWGIYDNMRGMPVGSNDALLVPNSSGAEQSYEAIQPTATGFQLMNGNQDTNASGNTYIYVAIRRGPMRTPTSGTSVFAPILQQTGTLTTGFPIDTQFARWTGGPYANNTTVNDRLRAFSSTTTANTTGALITSSTSAETIAINTLNWTNTTAGVPVQLDGTTGIYWNFRRAPSFFDVVCYTGNGGSAPFNHNLGVEPELIITKRRGSTSEWNVGTEFGATTFRFAELNLTTAYSPFSYGSNYFVSKPTATQFYPGSASGSGASGSTYVAYLFASCPGVSKVGTYTGNGSSQTINCGFAAGARFVMIKRTDSTGDWYVWDTARGIVAGNDPRLSLNSTAAEVTTDDSVDTDSSGFVVNQLSATNINVSSATYIYLAVA